MPILNKGCIFPSSVPLPLSQNLTFQRIRGDDLAAITEKDDDASSFLKGGSFVLLFTEHDSEKSVDDLQDYVIAALFALNILGSGIPISIEKLYIIRHLRTTSVYKTHIFGGNRHANLDRFTIDKGKDISFGTEIFDATVKALKRHPALRITLSRFNSAIGRALEDDRLIDLCISLESIFQSQTEISFQFALYNSILSESESDKRIGIFQTLKKLYGERSKVVHGNKDLDHNWFKEKWPDLVQITKASILRKIDFLTSNEHGQWKEFLEKRALGITDEQDKGPEGG